MVERNPLIAVLASGDLYNCKELEAGNNMPGIYFGSQGNLPATFEDWALLWCNVDPQEWFYYDPHFSAWISVRDITVKFVAHDMGARAENTLSGTTNFTAGDTVQVGPTASWVLTFVTGVIGLSTTTNTERKVVLGATLADSLRNLAAALGGSGIAGDSSLALSQYGYYTASNHLVVPHHVVGTTSMKVYSLIPGLAGNSTLVKVNCASSDVRWVTADGALANNTLGSLQFGGGNFVPGTELILPGDIAGIGASPFLGSHFPTGSKYALHSFYAKCPSQPKTSAAADASWSINPQLDGGNMLAGDITQTDNTKSYLEKQFVGSLTVWDGPKAVHMKVGTTGTFARLPAGTIVECGFKRVLT